MAYPKELLDRIEQAAKDAGVSRAEWLRQAAADAVQAAESGK
ncbi:ribbon-helix-helix protein, CopG family [Streptomyces sp. NPDC004647]